MNVVSTACDFWVIVAYMIEASADKYLIGTLTLETNVTNSQWEGAGSRELAKHRSSRHYGTKQWHYHNNQP